MELFGRIDRRREAPGTSAFKTYEVLTPADESFKGLVADIRLYDIELSPEAIRKLAQFPTN